jgi:two-component system chemotaxis sensor kinase CheA
MDNRENNFLKKLLATFRVEAEEHLQAISSGLLELEKAVSDQRRREVVENIFREAHSLKGAARSVNQTAMENTCQSLESVFSALKHRLSALLPTHLDLLHEAVESLRQLIRSPEGEPQPAAQAQRARLSGGLERILQDLSLPARREESAEPIAHLPLAPAGPLPIYAGRGAPEVETVRIPTVRLESLFLRAQELLAAGLSARQRVLMWRDIFAEVATDRKQFRELRSDLQALRRTLGVPANSPGDGRRVLPGQKILAFLDGQDDFLKSLEFRLRTAIRAAELDQEQLNAALIALLEEAKRTLMLPCAGLLEIFPPLVRRLAREQGKQVELVVEGGEVEIDKRILEEIKDPLIHIVRNCIDHGIEKTECRQRTKKPPVGTIRIALAQRDGKIELTIADDGAGIDVEKVRAAVVKLSLASSEEAAQWDDARTLPLVFESGVSTSAMITELSGRGLGLAIVREKVESLGGVVSLESRPTVGTRLRLVLPVTLATFRGVLVRVADREFVIPTAHVERVLRMDRKEVKTVENRETVPLDGRACSLVSLGPVLELPPGPPRESAGEHVILVLLRSGEKRIAFAVDEVLAEQEVLVKGLGKQLARVRNLAGVTVLGTGRVVPILNVPDLMKSAVKVRAAAVPPPVAVGTPGRRAILVVEDSITARTLLKNILESAGYDVKTAVDGADALTMLKSEHFDLLVSDVDMPRMNGFELTAKIRADKKFAELPVVLVTAMESREDRERGIEVGAHAYIVKSSFDQSNLLSVIGRLV